MFKIKSALIVLLGCLAIISCRSSQDKETSLTLKLQGTIKNNSEKSIDLYYIPLGYLKAEVLAKIPIDSLGNFSAELELDRPKQILVAFKQGQLANIFVFPGDDLTIDMDSEDFDASLKFQGQGAIRNNYLARKGEANGVFRKTNGDVYKLDSETYFAAFTQKKKDELTSFEQFKKQNTVEELFLDFEESDILGAYLKAVASYEPYYKWKNKVDTVTLTNDYEQVWEKFDITRNDSIMSLDYLEAIIHYFQMKNNENVHDFSSPTIVQLNQRVDIIQKESAQVPTEKLLLYMLYNQLDRNGLKDDVSKLMDAYLSTNPNDQHKALIEDKYAALNKLQPGQPAIDFGATNTEGKRKKLSDLKGRVVYVDMWASWCKPCIKEMPHSQKLIKDYEGNEDIAFLYLSVDDEKTDWEQFLEKHTEMTNGINWLGDGGFNSELMKEYQVRGIPAYLLIDKSGNIISTKAPRPSEQEQVTEMIDKALQKES